MLADDEDAVRRRRSAPENAQVAAQHRRTIPPRARKNAGERVAEAVAAPLERGHDRQYDQDGRDAQEHEAEARASIPPWRPRITGKPVHSTLSIAVNERPRAATEGCAR